MARKAKEAIAKVDSVDIDARTAEEADRVRDLLESCEVDEARIKVLEPLIVNTAWIKCKLDDVRQEIGVDNVAIPYDNGGGQCGIRENPLFKGYESLWKAYLAGMNKILEYLPSSVVEEEEEKKPQSVLQLVRSRHNA